MDGLEKADLQTPSRGKLRFIVNLQIVRDKKNKTITLSQESFIRNLVELFEIQDVTRRRPWCPTRTSAS